MSETHATIDQIFREGNGRVIVALAGRYRDLDAAEEAVQDAYLEALRIWPRKGTPSNPAAWITTLDQRQVIDRMRRDITYEDRLESIAGEQAMKPDIDDNPELGVPDKRLELIFACCHPALAREALVALTLRTLGRLTTGEIAHAFLVPKPTMAQRLVRPKLIDEAFRLGRILSVLMPDEAEVGGLLTLMELHHCRTSARVSADGDH